jgi:hypothetical protein
VTPAVYTQRDVILHGALSKSNRRWKTLIVQSVADVGNGHDRPADAGHVGLGGGERGWLRQGDVVGRIRLRVQASFGRLVQLVTILVTIRRD